ncbi:hypothetical protein RhiirC2_804911 [Rhizophagus irregularis]|uniref:Uncharacterized protein n=1 Tax=Rhizophagus irregularis TaxID=588596 RepID=A0A2N1KVY0_9GLOM|nr:hypothetical protein RhiirC2_804911 [Rhizophagus irregularis]
MDLVLVKVKGYSRDVMNEMISIEYNLRKFIKTLMNIKVTAEWSMLKSNGHEIPIDWNITWNLIHRYC